MYSAQESPSPESAAAQKRAVEVLPLVPATWMQSMCSSGRSSTSSMSTTVSSRGPASPEMVPVSAARAAASSKASSGTEKGTR